MPLFADGRAATPAYVAPFLAFVGIMAIERVLSVPASIAYPIRFFAVVAIVLVVSRRYLSFKPSASFASIALGAVVFAIWVGPDILFQYRHSFLFENAITGKAESAIPLELRQKVWFVMLRTLSCTMLVPIVEELFWRGWLMRWLIDNNFLKVQPGEYDSRAFWIVAILFAAEHGPYWEVGLIAGVLYNWWMVRTRSLADCMLAHAVTNGLLCIYVLRTGYWEYLL